MYLSCIAREGAREHLEVYTHTEARGISSKDTSKDTSKDSTHIQHLEVYTHTEAREARVRNKMTLAQRQHLVTEHIL